jgi:hypothetical protein
MIIHGLWRQIINWQAAGGREGGVGGREMLAKLTISREEKYSIFN